MLSPLTCRCGMSFPLNPAFVTNFPLSRPSDLIILFVELSNFARLDQRKYRTNRINEEFVIDAEMKFLGLSSHLKTSNRSMIRRANILTFLFIRTRVRRYLWDTLRTYASRFSLQRFLLLSFVRLFYTMFLANCLFQAPARFPRGIYFYEIYRVSRKTSYNGRKSLDSRAPHVHSYTRYAYKTGL